MGLFDYVDHRMKCPTCGTQIYEFQTKDRPWPELEKLNPLDLLNFYAFCPECRTWVEFTRVMPRAESIDAFVMTVRQDEAKKPAKDPKRM